MRRLQWKRHRVLLPMDRRRASPPPRLTAPEESWYEIRDSRLLGHCIHSHKRHGCTGWRRTRPAKEVSGLRQLAADTHFTSESACADDFAAQAAIGSPNAWGSPGLRRRSLAVRGGTRSGATVHNGQGYPRRAPRLSMATIVRFRGRLRQIESAAVVIKGNVHRRCG
jgi:hypothetical protein